MSSKGKRKDRQKRGRTSSSTQIVKYIDYLLEKADIIVKSDQKLAQIYAKQAKKIQTKTRTKFPPRWRKRFCQHCKAFLYPGINSKVRITSSNKVISIKCYYCKNYTRFPFYKKRSKDNER